MADIAKAFLNIKLKTNFDRNWFSFAFYDNGKVQVLPLHLLYSVLLPARFC